MPALPRIAVIAAVAATALLSSTGCSSSVPVTSWAGKEVLAVAQVDGEPFLVAADTRLTAALPGAKLTELGVSSQASIRILRSGKTRVLAWTSDNGPTRFAILDTIRGRIEPTSYSVDSGVLALDGDVIYSARLTGSGSVVEAYSLGRQAMISRTGLSFLPDELVSDGTSVVAVGGAEAGSQGAVLRGGPPSRGTFRLTAPGFVAGAAITRGRLVVALDRGTPAEGQPIGRPALLSAVVGSDLQVKKGGVARPRLVEPLGDGRVAVGDMVDGKSMLRIIDPSTGATDLIVPLASQTPLLDLVPAGAGRVAAVQNDRWTIVDPAQAATRSFAPPGEMLSSR